MNGKITKRPSLLPNINLCEIELTNHDLQFYNNAQSTNCHRHKSKNVRIYTHENLRFWIWVIPYDKEQIEINCKTGVNDLFDSIYGQLNSSVAINKWSSVLVNRDI
jgi:hypothetical protein